MFLKCHLSSFGFSSLVKFSEHLCMLTAKILQCSSREIKLGGVMQT